MTTYRVDIKSSCLNRYYFVSTRNESSAIQLGFLLFALDGHDIATYGLEVSANEASYDDVSSYHAIKGKNPVVTMDKMKDRLSEIHTFERNKALTPSKS